MNEAEVSWEVRARRAEAHLAALDVAVQGISGVLALEAVLHLIVDRVRDLADAEYAALGIARPDGVIQRFMTSGLSAIARERIGALPRGHGLLGLIIRNGQTFRIPEIAEDPRRHGFPPNHPEMHSFLGVPITVKGQAVGDLYLTNKRGAAEFSAEDQTLVERFAAHAGLAIENARLSERVQALAVVEERERIGRDLHDGIIQRIYGVTLGLDDVPEIALQDPAAAAERVDRAIDALHAAIAEIRTFIYGLRPGLDGPGVVASALETLAEEARLNGSMPIEVKSVGDTRLAPTIGAELISIAREALSNVVRHADASRATMEVTAANGEVRLEIADDGKGFDARTPGRGGHHGLANMLRRAESLGGSLLVESGPGRGTRIIVVLPLPE
ncbi:MAG: GAF domain-containing sensor histidine kinase [Chloroflexota bacterium]